MTGKRIKEAFSPPGSPVNGEGSAEGYGEVSGDEDNEDNGGDKMNSRDEKWKENNENEGGVYYFES